MATHEQICIPTKKQSRKRKVVDEDICDFKVEAVNEDICDFCEEDEPLRIGEETTVLGSTGTNYTVKRHPNKRSRPFYWCSCPARKYQGTTNGTDSCKHIDQLRNGSASASSVNASFVSTAPKAATAPKTSKFEVALACKYEPKHDIAGMVFMEKFDGIYAHYDVANRKMFTRKGNELFVPGWLIEQLPEVSVTGELYGGIGKFNEFQGLFNSNDTSNAKWSDVKFIIFDVVEECIKPMLFKDRMQFVEGYHTANVQTVKYEDCHSKKQVDEAFDRVVKSGGEGLMLRKNVPYRPGRSTDLLKYKRVDTIDAVVIGYKSSNANNVASVQLRTIDSGAEFYCVPKDRTIPPTLGTVVEIECMELTSRGVPRFPVWLRVRKD